MAIKLKVSETNASLKVHTDGAVRFEAEQGIPIYPEEYAGPYEATPTETEQTLETDGLIMTDDVTVGAIDSEYVGSDVPRRSALNVDGLNVSASAGYYAEEVSATVTPNLQDVSKEYSPSTTDQTETFSAGSGYDGIGDVSVTVNAAPLQEKSRTVGASGTYEDTADSGYYGLSKVTNTVPSGSMSIVYDTGFTTVNNNRKWRFRGTSNVNPKGWFNQGNNYGSYISYDALEATTVTPTESQQTVGGANTMMEGAVTVGAISSTYVGSGIDRRNETDLSASGATVTVPAGYYAEQETKSVASGTAGTPTATKSAVSNHSVNVTPSVTNTTGYITGGTKTGTAVSVSASELVSGTYTVDSSGTKDVTNYASASVPAGTAGSPALTVSAVENHSKTIRSSVINQTGWITGGTVSGASTTVKASDLVSGSQNITSNANNIDVTNLASVNVQVPSGSADLVVTVSYNSGTQMWEPDKTLSEILAAYNNGDEIAFRTDVGTNAVVDGIYQDSDYFRYDIYETSYDYMTGLTSVLATSYTYDSNGVHKDTTYEYKERPILQNKSKSYTPTTTQQTESVTADNGYDGLDTVNITVNAMPSGSVTAPSSITGSSATVSTGTNTLTLSKTVSVTPNVTTAGYVSSGTAGNSTVSLSASVQTKGASTYRASTSQQTVASGTYLTGALTIAPVSQTNLTAENIKDGTTISISDGANNIWSVTGTYSGGGGGTSKNTQVVQGTTRTTSSTLTAIGAEMTVSKTGTYDVYWSAFRSNTSSQYTFATKLYINGTGYGSEQTTWSNHQQNVHLSNVSLTVNDKIRVYGRESRGSSYYMYAGTLTIVEA